ncbi:hypothetical protein GCK32_001684 [Trichostrongylus colubriformis]|uniref:Serum response factor-binding protein 1 n=1 Tax=Trichostrongylus colubriformis TaxID=6319 RepID=A0AAN8EYV6_TRICO
MASKKKSKKTAVKSTTARRPESDEEDYEVADLSAIPAPHVEFVMPNLTPLDSGKVEPMSKPKPNPKKNKSSSSEGPALTAEQLNNEIVQMRSVIKKARIALVRHHIRQLKRWKSTLAKKPSEALQRKMRRYEEEMHALKSIPKDDVSKFALLNKKGLNELGITGTTPLNERCLFKLACERCVVKAVEDYRSRYPSWEVTTAFLLQRLGLQYSVGNQISSFLSCDSNKVDQDDEAQGACNSKKPAKSTRTHALLDINSRNPKRAESMDDISHRVNRVKDCDSSAEEDYDVEIGSDSDGNEDQAAENRRKLLLGSTDEPVRRIKKKNKKTLEKKTVMEHQGALPSVLYRKRLETAVVKQVKLNEGGKIEIEKPVRMESMDTLSSEAQEEEDKSQNESFFLPASLATKIEPKKRSCEIASPALSETPLSKRRGSDIELKKSTEKKKKNLTESVKRPLRKPKAHSSIKESQIPIEELHPSWAAHRRAKEQQNLVPQGKRIVFSDD